MGWRHHTEPREGPLHVWPEDDLIVHDLDDMSCACGPEVERYEQKLGPPIYLIIHYALNRELEDA